MALKTLDKLLNGFVNMFKCYVTTCGMAKNTYFLDPLINFI